jgi:hypothetical protein
MANIDKHRPPKAKTFAEALVTASATIGFFVLLNVVTCQSYAKVDLTETGIYSLSAASKRLVKDLPEKLVIKAYFGNVPAEYADRQRYIESLLEEYAEAGQKVDYTRYEVNASDSPEALPRQKELEADGIEKLILITFRDDGNKQIPAYFHVQFSYLGKKDTWAVRSARDLGLEGIEYEFSSRIRRLVKPQKKVGVSKGYGESEQTQAISAPGQDIGQGIRVGLGDSYEVVPTDWKASPAALRDLDALIVNGPTERVSEVALWELDQFVMSGKPVVFLVKGMDWKSSQNQMQMMANPGEDAPFLGTPVDDGLTELLATWGFEVQRNVIIDGRQSVVGVIPIGNPPLLTNGFFPKVSVLNPERGQALEGMPGLVTPFASSVKLVGPLEKDNPAFKVEPLLRTSGAAFAKGELMILTRQTQTIDQKGAAPGPFMVAVAGEGPWPSAYAGKPSPAGLAPGPEAKPQAPAGTRLVVVGGQAFADDSTFGIMRAVGDPSYLNGFIALHGLVDWGMQDQELLSVRTKQVLRPVDPVEPGRKLVIKYGNAAGVPLLFVLFGVVLWRTRESRRRKIRL